MSRILESVDSKGEFKEFDLDLIWTTPILMSEDKHVNNVIASHENLNKFIEIMKTWGEVINVTFKKALYQKQDILSVLIDKQREIIIAAHKYGYYDYPKKITSKKLSERVNISKGTMVEHLRKAEGRLLAEILTGIST